MKGMREMVKILCEGKKIKLKLEDNEKKSMLITGQSRMGKTFFASNLAAMLAEDGYLVHLIDLGEKWGKEDKKRLLDAGAVMQKAGSDGINFVFRSAKELMGATRIIANAVCFQSENVNAVLQNTFRQLMDNGCNMWGMSDIVEILEEKMKANNNGNEWEVKLHDRLNSFGIPNINLGTDTDQSFSGVSSILELSGLDDTYVPIATYLFLFSLLCQQKRRWKNGSMKKGVFVIIDEFQNLECDRKSIIGKCLTEGQKYKLNLILITQFLNGGFPDSVISQFKQGGYRFHFRLTEEEAAIVSRQIAYKQEVRKEIYQKLTFLPPGCCLMLGLHSVENRRDVSEQFRFVKIEEEVKIQSKCTNPFANYYGGKKVKK